jgi:hypothetical protein
MNRPTNMNGKMGNKAQSRYSGLRIPPLCFVTRVTTTSPTSPPDYRCHEGMLTTARSDESIGGQAGTVEREDPTYPFPQDRSQAESEVSTTRRDRLEIVRRSFKQPRADDGDPDRPAKQGSVIDRREGDREEPGLRELKEAGVIGGLARPTGVYVPGCGEWGSTCHGDRPGEEGGKVFRTTPWEPSGPDPALPDHHHPIAVVAHRNVTSSLIRVLVPQGLGDEQQEHQELQPTQA